MFVAEVVLEELALEKTVVDAKGDGVGLQILEFSQFLLVKLKVPL